jgi:hypothetical protein
MRFLLWVALVPALAAHAAPTKARKGGKQPPDAGVARVPGPDAGVPALEPSLERFDAGPPPHVEPVDAGPPPLLLAVELPDAGVPDVAAAEPPEPPADPTILGLLLKKNILTQAEYESAMAGLPPPDEGRAPLMGKWAASMYGFIEADGVGDSTQSFLEQSANGPIVRPGSYAAAHPRSTFGIRNSRLGVKLATPTYGGRRASGVVEIDFFGNAVASDADAVVFTAAGPRFRHLAMLLETPYVDLLIGQWWQLFGWQPNFFPSSVEIQGMVGEVYGRAPQVRLSHLFKSLAVSIELAASAGFNPQKDVLQPPDAQLGVRVALNTWRGVRTSGATSTRVDPLMFGLSGDVRRFAVPGLNEGPSVSTLGWGIALDALVPIIPATMESRAHALTLNASFVQGAGISDLFSGLTAGGVTFPSGYRTGLAPGFVAFDKSGALQAVQWRAFRLGLQYYLPPSGNVWLSLDGARLDSPNATQLTSDPTKTVRLTWLGDVNLFVNVTSALRFGFAYALMWQQYADATVARNHRGIVSAFFLF